LKTLLENCILGTLEIDLVTEENNYMDDSVQLLANVWQQS